MNVIDFVVLGVVVGYVMFLLKCVYVDPKKD